MRPLVVLIFIATSVIVSTMACGRPIGFVDDATIPGGMATCDQLQGTFQATDVGFTSVTDPTRTADLRQTGGEFTLAFEQGRFRSEFAQPGQAPIVRTGTVSVAGDGITMGTDPLLPGMRPPGTTPFACQVVGGDTLVIGQDTTGFDFSDAGVFEDARFEATFERLPF